MKELVVISGKGGTGKTSIVASFAALAESAVLADCDVDAADLHLVLEPTVRRTEDFSGGKGATIVTEKCTACGKCLDLCRFGAVKLDGSDSDRTYRVDPIACEGCGVCAHFCPSDAIEFAPVTNGQWFASDTRFGPMVHAKLGVAEENSGKLVSLVRKEARRIAEDRQLETIIVDGSPGIGCPVIASITGADLVLVVTEPTLSGLHDLGRVTNLTHHFGIETLVCVNKWDVNGELTETIESEASKRSLTMAGRIRYDNAVTRAQLNSQSVAEFTDTGSGQDVRTVWRTVRQALDNQKKH